MEWNEAVSNIGRRVRFTPEYPGQSTYEGRIVGVDHPRGQPGVSDVYLITSRNENTPATMWESTMRVPVDQVEYLSERIPFIATEIISEDSPPVEVIEQSKIVVATWVELQTMVHEWNQKNFGMNAVENFKVCLDDHLLVDRNPLVELNWVCPLMGLMEETGEFFGQPIDALLMNYTDPPQRYDALGDISIYLCDYASRHGFRLDGDYERTQNAMMEAPLGLIASVGQLFHANLKMLQKIRGFDDPQKHQRAIYHWAHSIICYGNRIARDEFNKTLLEIAVETFEEVVSKRNWKANKTEGSQA